VHNLDRWIVVALITAVATFHLQAQIPNVPFGRVVELKPGHEAVGIFLGDWNGDGALDLATYGASLVRVHVQGTQPTAWQSRAYRIGATVTVAAGGRFNKDRYDDLVVVTQDPDELRVFTSNPRELPAMTSKLQLSDPVEGFLVADIDNDGISDVLLYGRKSLGVTVYRGRSDGTLQTPIRLFEDLSITTLQIVDMNGDGINDIVATNWISNSEMVWTGFGKMKFSDPVMLRFPMEPVFAAIAGLNNDLDHDLVVALKDEAGFHTYFGNGLGGYTQSQYVPASGHATQWFVSDVDGDGKEDVVLFNSDEKALQVSMNAGNGFMHTPIPIAAGIRPIATVLFHQPGSRSANAAVLQAAPNPIRIFLNLNAPAPRSVETAYCVGLAPVGVYPTDINKDGWEDFIVANSSSRSVSLFINQGHGLFKGQYAINVAADPKWVEFVPIDDAEGYILANDPERATVSVVKLNRRTLADTSYTLPTRGRAEVLSGRVDSSSGNLNVYLFEFDSTATSGQIVAYEEFAPGRFVERVAAIHRRFPMLAATMSDYDGDGMLDLVCALFNTDTSRMEVYQARGRVDGQFDPPRFAFALEERERVSLRLWSADLNRDRIPDLVINILEPRNVLMTALGRKDTTMSPPSFRTRGDVTISAAANLQIVDINGDGWPDILLNHQVRRYIQLHIGRGDGTFLPRIRLRSTGGVGGFTVTDVDDDGSLELVVTDYANGVVKIIPPEEEP
jgi:hypothetical protein